MWLHPSWRNGLLGLLLVWGAILFAWQYPVGEAIVKVIAATWLSIVVFGICAILTERD